jgi:spore coat polysaccharide biosynthesis predicted glycosyltransferase SpsG
MPELLILTEAGPTIGMGHLTRCTAIAAAFRGAGWKVTGFVDTEGAELPLPESFAPFPWKVEQTAYLTSGVVCLVDSYLVSETWVQSVEAQPVSCLYIDDAPRRHYRRGTVLDWTIHAENEAFGLRHRNVTYLLGVRYCCVRQEFLIHARVPREPQTVLVTMGGSDIRNLTPRVLRYFRSSHPETRLLVVVGPGVRERSYLREDWPRCEFFFNCSALEMVRLMDRASYALTAGGQTLYEAACRGLPPVAVEVVENQRQEIQGFVSEGFALDGGTWDSPDLEKSWAEACARLSAPSELATRAAKGRMLVDGCGPQRILAEMVLVPRREIVESE